MNENKCLIAKKNDIDEISKMAKRFCATERWRFLKSWCGQVPDWPQEDQIIAKDKITFIAKEGNKITGVLILHSKEPSSNSPLSEATAAEFELATDPSFLRLGVATHLLNCAIQHAKNNTNVKQLRAMILPENDESITLCKCKFKFRVVSTQREGITMTLDIK